MVNHPLGGSLSPIVLFIYFRGPRFLLFIRPSHLLFFRLSTGLAIKKSGQTEEVQFFLKVVVVYYYCSGKKKRYDLRVRSSGSPVWRLMEEGDHPPSSRVDRRQQVRGHWGGDRLKAHAAEEHFSRHAAARARGRAVRCALRQARSWQRAGPGRRPLRLVGTRLGQRVKRPFPMPELHSGVFFNYGRMGGWGVDGGIKEWVDGWAEREGKGGL